MANNLRLFGVGVAIAGEQASASATELLELETELLVLDTELAIELLRLDDELDLLLELDTTIVVELAELEAELSIELDKELDLRLLALPRLDEILPKLELILLDVELILACELAALDTTTMTEELLWELSLDELEKLLKDTTEEDPTEEDVTPTLDDTEELDKEDTATLDDTGGDKDDELNTATDELVTATTEVLEKALPPPPPPQDAKKVTDNNNVLIFNCLNDAIDINDSKGCILLSPRTRQAKHRCVILIL